MAEDILSQGRGPMVNPLKYPQITCDKCGHNIFRSAVIFYDIPGFVVGTGSENFQYPLPVYICDKCGTVVKHVRDEIDAVKEKAEKENKGTNLIL